jgi:hypothetical protein
LVSDIVEWLRERQTVWTETAELSQGGWHGREQAAKFAAAADEIERLRRDLATLCTSDEDTVYLTRIEWEDKCAEVERLRADRATVSRSLWDALAEVERLRGVILRADDTLEPSVTRDIIFEEAADIRDSLAGAEGGER